MAGVPSPSRKRRATLAFKAHIGWAYGVLVAEADGSVEIVAKQRVTMRETFEAAAVYHVGHERGLSAKEVQPTIDAALLASVARAKEAIGALAASAGERCLRLRFRRRWLRIRWSMPRKARCTGLRWCAHARRWACASCAFPRNRFRRGRRRSSDSRKARRGHGSIPLALLQEGPGQPSSASARWRHGSRSRRVNRISSPGRPSRAARSGWAAAGSRSAGFARGGRRNRSR